MARQRTLDGFAPVIEVTSSVLPLEYCLKKLELGFINPPFTDLFCLAVASCAAWGFFRVRSHRPVRHLGRPSRRCLLPVRFSHVLASNRKNSNIGITTNRATTSMIRARFQPSNNTQLIHSFSLGNKKRLTHNRNCRLGRCTRAAPDWGRRLAHLFPERRDRHGIVVHYPTIRIPVGP